MILVKPSHEILTEIDGDAILARIEQAGRVCYKTEAKITPASAKTFVEARLKQGHHSIIEHESVSVKIICDRGVTHEIVRHRLCAYSQESTRYCNYKGGVTFVMPPWVDLQLGSYVEEVGNKYLKRPWWPSFKNNADACWFRNMLSSEKEYIYLLNEGWSSQQARSVLPNSLKTEIIMTANIREWRHILKLRTSKAAHPQMREVMIPILAEFRARIPVLFDDIEPME